MRRLFCLWALVSACGPIAAKAVKDLGEVPVVTIDPIVPNSFGPTDTVSLSFSSTVLGATFVIDETDGVVLARPTGSSTSFPAAPLSPGEHSIAVVVIGPDGQRGSAATTITRVGPVVVPGTGTVSVNVTGLFGDGLIVGVTPASGIEQTLALSADGEVSFPAAFPLGAFNARIVDQPIEPRQTCTLGAPTGDVTATGATVSITCGDRHPRDIPRVFFTDLLSGPATGGANDNGVFLTIYGEGFGPDRPTVTIGGVEVAAYLPYGPAEHCGEDRAPARKLDCIVVQPGAAVPSGAQPVVVRRWNRSPSNALSFTVRPGAIRFLGGPSASNANAGTDPAAPWATIAHMQTQLQRGMIVYMRQAPFTAASGNCVLCVGAVGGAGSEPVAFVGYPGDPATLESSMALTPTLWHHPAALIQATAPAATIAKLRFLTGEDHVAIVGDNARIVANIFDANTVTDASNVWIGSGSDGARIIGNDFGAQSLSDHVYIGNGTSSDALSDVEIGWNRFAGSAQASSEGYGAAIAVRSNFGIDAANTLAYSNIRVHHNHIGVSYRGVFLADSYDNGGIQAPQTKITGVEVTNNLFTRVGTNNNTEVVTVEMIQGTFAFRHNTLLAGATNVSAIVKLAHFSRNCVGSTLCTDGATPIDNLNEPTLRFENSLVQLTTGTLFDVSDISPMTVPATVTCPSNVWSLPLTTFLMGQSANEEGTALFVDEVNGDYTLTPTSPGFATGVASVITDDYLGFPRPATPDRGAFQSVD